MPRGRHTAKPCRGSGIRPSCPLEVVNLIQSSVVDRRTFATIESPPQGDRAFAPTCKAEPIRGRAKGSGHMKDPTNG